MSELNRLREVMDRLRSPGGCPWDGEQTHASLLKYLLEESYEFVEAVELDDREAMREELGDLLLQVYFHARVAEDHESDPFDVEEVAGAVADKLIRRHPHVFGDAIANTSEDVMKSWEAQKVAEKGRTSALDGVPLAQPALMLANKLAYRVDKFGYGFSVEQPVKIDESTTQEGLGEILFGIIEQAQKQGLDAEAALRGAVTKYIRMIEEYERNEKENARGAH
jgi:XTP/dITP diphosphohydrolase